MLGTPGVRLTTVELAYGSRDFELPEREGVNRVRVRGGDHVLWHKENLLNIAVSALPASAEYVAFVDGDVLFLSRHWAQDTLDALQLHRVVQVSDRVIWLGPKGQFIGDGSSFMSQYLAARSRHYQSRFYHPSEPVDLDHGFPGHSWAWRRDAWQAVNGLMDVCILGAGDYHMAHGLFGLKDPLLDDNDYTPEYRAAIGEWGHAAREALAESVGSVPAITFHLWHGCLANRRYSTREQILIRNHYDPGVDIVRDAQGLLGFAGNKPKLEADIRAYFGERDEDSTWLGPGRG